MTFIDFKISSEANTYSIEKQLWHIILTHLYLTEYIL